jgi:hypothetical protein
MITLVSGFFVAYFALLKFLGLGIDDITRETVVAPFYAGIPALLFIISIISFIISYASYAPILMKDRTVSKVEEIVKYMDKIWPLLLSFIREVKSQTGVKVYHIDSSILMLFDNRLPDLTLKRLGEKIGLEYKRLSIGWF